MTGNLISIQSMIHEVQEHKVMLDKDLAALYGVEIKRLNEAVKRNITRFPIDFMFQLTKNEWTILRSQIATLRKDNRKYLLTENGVNKNALVKIF